MSAKHLTESGWKDFAKTRDLKDAAMLKALAAFGKSAAKGVWEQRATLDEVYKQSEVLLKATKADRDAQKYISELQREIDAERANLAKAEKADKTAAAAAAKNDDDEDSPALLSSKLLVHFKALNADERAVRPFVIGVLNNQKFAVLLHKTAINASQKKVVAEHLGGAGVKWLMGECRFEKNAYTFAMSKSIGGLAAKLAKAIHEQTNKKFKVRVRGIDPADVDEDTEEEAAPAAVKKAPVEDKKPSRPNLPPGAADAEAAGPAAAGAIPTPPPFPAKKAPAKVLSGAGAATKPAPGAVGPAEADQDSDEALLKELNDWLEDKTAKIEQVAAAAGDKGKPLRLKLSEAKALFRQKRVGPMAEAVDDIKAMIAKLRAASAPASAVPGGAGSDSAAGPAPTGKAGAAAPLSPKAQKLMDALTALAPKVAARMGAEKEADNRKRVREANNHVHKLITQERLAGADAALRALIRYLKTPVEE